MSLLEAPRVDGAPVANQLEQAWLAKLLGGPSYRLCNRGTITRVVEQPTETLLIGDVRLDVFGELPMLQVGAHDARVVGPVSVARRRRLDRLENRYQRADAGNVGSNAFDQLPVRRSVGSEVRARNDSSLRLAGLAVIP